MWKSAVVRVFATTQEPDHVSPWQSESPREGSGSGVVVAPGRILTGAHVVADATFLQVQKIAEPDKFLARVAGVCHDADLALLAIDDPRFMHDVTPAPLGELPDFQDRVLVVGFPVGGDEISVTEGIVSRIELQRYSHSSRELLAVTVDAAINEGNSGGPVLDDEGHVVGIAFQSLEDAENIGEMVPAPIIRRFLDGIEQQRPLEVPGLGIHTQNLENPTLRRVVGLANGESGVLVENVDFDSSAWGAVEPGDALLAIDGHGIANNGTIRYRERYRTGFEVLLGERFTGDPLPLTLLRDGRRRDVELELRHYRPLVPHGGHDREPQWFVFGGLVFQTLSRDYLATWRDKWWERAPRELVHLYFAGVRQADRRELVVLTQVLADEINIGYSPFQDECVVSIGGERPVDLADFARRIDACAELVDLRTSLGGRIVLDAAAAREAGPRILARYRVPTDRSEALTAGARA